jgi:hypothetical protein
VAHAYNPSYSGGRDQKDCGSKQSQANSLQYLSEENPSHKRAGRVVQGVGPEIEKKKKKKK